jgi:Tfp pilus assembly protein PilF
MTTARNLFTIGSVAVLALVSTGCEKLRARDHLNKGVQTFKSAKYNQAVEHFKESVRLDPDYMNARLYLATAYMSQYIPGADSPENMQNAKAAEQEFLRVLEREPNNSLAVESIASLHYNQAQGNQPLEHKLRKLDDAAKWYQKLAEVDPKSKTAFYSLGVITWAKWYPALMAARNKLGMKPEDPGPIKDPKVKAELKNQWLEQVNAGIQNLERALQIDPEYDEAMAYMNLLIRERADLADSPDQYKKDIEVADNWVQKALDTKKIKAERAAKQVSQGIHSSQ